MMDDKVYMPLVKPEILHRARLEIDENTQGSRIHSVCMVGTVHKFQYGEKEKFEKFVRGFLKINVKRSKYMLTLNLCYLITYNRNESI